MKRHVVLLVLLAAPAWAQSKPTLIDFPLDSRLQLNAAQQDALQTTFRQLLARNPAVLVVIWG